MHAGSIIHSDQWEAYNQIVNMPEFEEDYTVCHECNFVDPVTGVHKNGVEGMWANAKAKIKATHWTSRSFIFDYLAEFMFRQRSGCILTVVELIENFFIFQKISVSRHCD